MAKVKILTVPDPILRRQSKPIGKVDKKVLKIIADLTAVIKIQKDPMGIGLSAVQIGKPQRIFLAKIGDELEAFINPEIAWFSEKKTLGGPKEDEAFLEGCLSVPRYYGEVLRSQKIKIQYLNSDGEIKIRDLSGLEARIVQHEYDHLNGVLFIDHLLKQKGRLYQVTKRPSGEEILRETSLIVKAK